MEEQTTASAPFTGMPKDAVRVLKELEKQESFDWMRAHRIRVRKALRDPFVGFLRMVTQRFEEEGFELEGSERTLFRLHRDQRFHQNRRPFHGHIEAVFAKDGQRIGSRASIHVRLDSSGGFLRAGSFLQPPETLRQLRKAMVARESRFLDIAATMEQRGCGLVARKVLKRAPVGFNGVSNPVLADYLRLVDPTTERRLAPMDWMSDRIVDKTIDFARTCRPWLLFVQEAVARR